MNGGPKPAEDAGAKILNAVLAYLRRFVVYPSEHAAIAHALWIAHTHRMDAWESTPRIAFLSPEPGSGKSRALEITETLVPTPVQAVNVSAAYLFRKVSDAAGMPTILFDEIDTVFGPKAKENEEVRGLINAGHRRGAIAGRCVIRGKGVELEELPAYCAVAVAGVGDLPDTIITRSVVIAMRKRAPSEAIEPYRPRLHAAAGNKLRDILSLWAGNRTFGEPWPTMPESVTDRNADVWEPLLAIADAAGGDWPKRSRVAAVELVALAMWKTPSLGVRLLADVRTVFGDRDSMPTELLLEDLCKLDESPWGDLRGKPLRARGLAALLRKFGVVPRVIRIGPSTPRGYLREDLHDPWIRYLTPLGAFNLENATSTTSTTLDPVGTSSIENETSATTATIDPEADIERSAIEAESGDYEAASRGS
jgi:Protein of unknown function (DUF3631)